MLGDVRGVLGCTLNDENNTSRSSEYIWCSPITKPLLLPPLNTFPSQQTVVLFHITFAPDCNPRPCDSSVAIMKGLSNPWLPFFFGAKRGEAPELSADDLTAASSPKHLGKLWQGQKALKAYQRGSIFSNRNGPSVRLCLRHVVDDDGKDKDARAEEAQTSIWFAWVDAQGTLHPFRKLHAIPRSTVDRRVANRDDHMQRTYLGHAFLFVLRDKDDETEDEEEWECQSLEEVTVIGAYRPQVLSTDPEIEEDDWPCHILEISWANPSSPARWLRCACLPTPIPAFSSDFPLTLWEGDPLAILDTTTTNYYEETKMAQWPVRMEKDCFGGRHKNEIAIFQQDLAHALRCLPGHAYRALKASKTYVYVNKSFRCGPNISPVPMHGMCYHPNAEWLVDHGYHAAKAGCVELYDSQGYTSDRHYWGKGGVLVHEFAHAYHHKCLPDGYDNEEIEACYEAAMREGLYEKVKVHGEQGPTARAYACENSAEYFAELSAAFLGGRKGEEEYNKWYPFNRSQIKEHDPRAYKLLCKAWKVRA